MYKRQVFLQTYGVSPSLAVKIFKVYGERVQDVIRKNPYRLVEDVSGVGFKTADRIAFSLGVEKESDYRLCAGVKYALEDAAGGSGHTYLPRPMLLQRAARLLEVEPELLERAIDALILSHELVAREMEQDGETTVAVYLPSYYSAEGEVARRLRELLEAMPSGGFEDVQAQIGELERVEGIAFHSQQRLAIETAVRSGMTVITGGPGTGKTTIINLSLIHICSRSTPCCRATSACANRWTRRGAFTRGFPPRARSTAMPFKTRATRPPSTA